MVRVIASQPAADPDPVYLALVGGLAATFIGVALFFYLPILRGLGRWYLRQTIRRLKKGRRFLQIGRLGPALWAIDAVVVAGWRVAIAGYGAFALLFVVPVLLTVGAFWLASATLIL